MLGNYKRSEKGVRSPETGVTIESFYLGAGNQMWSSRGTASAFNRYAISPDSIDKLIWGAGIGNEFLFY